MVYHLNCNNILFFQIRLHVRQQQNPKFSSPKAKGAVLDPDLNREVVGMYLNNIYQHGHRAPSHP